MKTLMIKLSTIEEVRKFVNIVCAFDGDVDLKSGRYIIDAKSIMGIFSLDLSKPIDLCIHADESTITPIMDVVNPYICQ